MESSSRGTGGLKATTATRLQAATGSLLMGTGVALTDYLDSPRRRTMAYAGLLTVGIGVIGMIPRAAGGRYLFPDDPALLNDQLRQQLGDLGITPGPASDHSGARGPVATWIYLGLFLLFFAVLIRVDMVLTKRLARVLSRRGIARPYTVIGMFYAAAVYAAYELDMGMK